MVRNMCIDRFRALSENTGYPENFGIFSCLLLLVNRHNFRPLPRVVIISQKVEFFQVYKNPPSQDLLLPFLKQIRHANKTLTGNIQCVFLRPAQKNVRSNFSFWQNKEPELNPNCLDNCSSFFPNFLIAIYFATVKLKRINGIFENKWHFCWWKKKYEFEIEVPKRLVTIEMETRATILLKHLFDLILALKKFWKAR